MENDIKKIMNVLDDLNEIKSELKNDENLNIKSSKCEQRDYENETKACGVCGTEVRFLYKFLEDREGKWRCSLCAFKWYKENCR